MHAKAVPSCLKRARYTLKDELEGGDVIVAQGIEDAARVGEVLVGVVGEVPPEAARVPREYPSVVVGVGGNSPAGNHKPDGAQVHRVVDERPRRHTAATCAGWDPERLESASPDVDGGLVGDEVAVAG